MDVPVMRIEVLGLPARAVRVQVSSPEMVMAVDLERDAAIRHAVNVLQQAGVTALTINPDGIYRAEN